MGLIKVIHKIEQNKIELEGIRMKRTGIKFNKIMFLKIHVVEPLILLVLVMQK